MSLKSIICYGAGVVGAALTKLFGVWNGAMTTLCIFMALDYITGIAVAMVFHNSDKTEHGGLESKAGWKGLIRKGITLAIVSVSYRLDLLIGTDYIKNAVIIAFCANEVISLIENAALMGVPVPDTISHAIEVLRRRDRSNDKNTSD